VSEIFASPLALASRHCLALGVSFPSSPSRSSLPSPPSQPLSCPASGETSIDLASPVVVAAVAIVSGVLSLFLPPASSLPLSLSPVQRPARLSVDLASPVAVAAVCPSSPVSFPSSSLPLLPPSQPLSWSSVRRDLRRSRLAIAAGRCCPRLR
ncbi:hypothetical protein ACLOJK_034218, partial [Asimina triloba]